MEGPPIRKEDCGSLCSVKVPDVLCAHLHWRELRCRVRVRLEHAALLSVAQPGGGLGHLLKGSRASH